MKFGGVKKKIKLSQKRGMNTFFFYFINAYEVPMLLLHFILFI